MSDPYREPAPNPLPVCTGCSKGISSWSCPICGLDWSEVRLYCPESRLRYPPKDPMPKEHLCQKCAGITYPHGGYVLR
jgi:hypothetical protein